MCHEAKEYSFASICIQPVFVKLCAQLLAGSPVGVTTVVGFPLGADKPEVKAFAARQAVADGATEVDMVMNIGQMLEGNYEAVKEDIAAVVSAVDQKAIVKVIIETAYLSPEQITRASLLVKEAGADFVKASTGFAPSGAKAEDVGASVRQWGEMGIKAAGGISSYQVAEDMLSAGATRLAPAAWPSSG